MSVRIVAVNAAPRKNWNTDTLLAEAVKGAGSAGAEVEAFDLFRLERYTGCVSCFGCKKERNRGHCVNRDGLTPVLDAVREADGLILASPVYVRELTASFRALYERLVFQNLTYSLEEPCCGRNPVPVLLLVTCGAPEPAYSGLLEQYLDMLGKFVGPAEGMLCSDTLQISDYSRTDWPWTMIDPQKKYERHNTVFPEDCRRAFSMGADLAGSRARRGGGR